MTADIEVERFKVSTAEWLGGLHSPFGRVVHGTSESYEAGSVYNQVDAPHLSRFFTPNMAIRTIYANRDGDHFIMFERRDDNPFSNYYITVGYVPMAGK